MTSGRLILRPIEGTQAHDIVAVRNDELRVRLSLTDRHASLLDAALDAMSKRESARLDLAQLVHRLADETVGERDREYLLRRREVCLQTLESLWNIAHASLEQAKSLMRSTQ